MYSVMWEYDGVPDEQTASIPLRYEDAIATVKYLKRRHASRFTDPKLDVMIVDLETGRAISYVL